MNPLKNISLILSLCIITSCAESLDFNQLDDYVLKPILTSSLTYFTVKPFQFFDETGIQQNSREDIVAFDLFQDSIIVDNVVKMVFNAEFKNEFDRDVSIQVDFLDDDDALVFSFNPLFIESKDINPPPYETEIIFEENLELLEATKVRIIASLENTGSPMNPFDNVEFEFKSSVTLFIESDL